MNDFNERIASLTPEKRALLERHFLKKRNCTSIKKQGICRRGTTNPCALSFAQERLWFLDQLEPGSSAYNMPVSFRLTGDLRVSALEQSLSEILRRHEILRTTFVIEDDQPVQIIAPPGVFTLPLTDLSALPAEQREAKAREISDEEASRPFDLEAGPLLRASLLHLAAEEHLLLVTMHHIISDGWSMGIFYRELSALYEAFSQGKPSPLTDLPIQYGDFAVWQRRWLQGEKLEEQIRFWKDHLRDITVLELPTDHQRPAVQTFKGARFTFQLSSGLTETLRNLNQKEQVTLFMTLLAAFQCLLHRYTGQDDIVVGTPISNRNNEETEGLIGFFVNTMVTRADTSGNPVFRDLLKGVRKRLLDAYTHRDLPFEKLVEELRPERDLSRNPLFQISFALQNFPFSDLDLSDLITTRIFIEDTRTKFDLEVYLEEKPEGIRGSFVYNTALFNAVTIERMAGHYQKILEGIVADPNQRISDLPLLTEAERHQLLEEWNDTAADYPGDKCIHELFEEQVERTPEAIALVFEDQELTYRELNAKANQMANYLRKQGVGSEVMVGICVERSLEMIIAILGILKAGGAYIPMDPVYPEERLAFMLEDTQASVLITQAGLRERLPVKNIRAVCMDDDWEIISQESPDNFSSGASPDNLAYVIYTSGSTGKPKGVLVTHYNVARLFEATWQWFHFSNEDVWTLFHSYAFDFSVWELWGALFYGSRLVIVPFWVSRSPDRFLDLLIKEKVTVLNMTPSAFRQLMQEERDMPDRKGKLALRLVIFGGESLQVNTLRPWFEKHGDRSPQLVNMYGITETTVHVTYQPLTASDAQATAGSLIGRPIPDLQIYLLDQNFHPVPIGVSGEIYVGGGGLARGYLNRPQLTAERFVPNPFSEKTGSRLYKTGDLARYLPDGNLEFLGRIDHQVKIRGFRIELGEVGAVLGHHPDVRETVIVAREDESDDKRLVAYVVLDEKSAATTNNLRSFMREKLPDYMMPAAFVMLDALPLTPNGKVDHKALPAPEPGQLYRKEAFIAPRIPIEEVLAGIWCNVLGLKEVGIHDNFFELGGDSLSATRVIAGIRDALALEFSLVALFEAPSVAQMAKVIPHTAQTAGLKLSALPCSLNNKVAPLSSGQQEIWLTARLFPDVPIFNEPFTIHYKEQIDPIAMERALNQLICRHEILRTAFSTKNESPVQTVHEKVILKLRMEDLRSYSVPAREAEALRRATEEARQPFDLSNPPLLRAMLVQLGDSDDRLYLVLHHIITDAVSMYNVFVPELWSHYKSEYNGGAAPLAELPIQYSDYAKWQQERLQTPVMQDYLIYWSQRLNGVLPLELPTDRPRPPIQTFRGSFQTLDVSQELTHELKALGRREGCTLYMVLLAAFKTLLWRYTQQDDLVVGTVDAGRARPGLEPLMGYFLNMLVIRTNLSGDHNFKEFLHQVRQVALEAYAHKDLPFITLLDTLKLMRDPTRHPLFQVAFVMEPAFSAQESGWTVSQLEVQTGTAKFDLTLELEEREDQIIGRLEYSTDLFDPATIARMAGHYQKILEGIVENPDLRLSELQLLTDAEQHQLLVEWNRTATDYPKDKCIHELFEDQVERIPDAIAVVFEGQQLTYRELNSKANQLAHYLRKQGVGHETLVGICVERSLEMIIGIVGILKAGGAYVPLDPAYPKERLAFMISDTQAPVLLTQQRVIEMLPVYNAVLICLDTDWGVIIAQESKENTISGVRAANLAYVIYTSGSTGNPKGVAIEHHSTVNLVNWSGEIYGSAELRGVLASTSICFDLSVFELFATLCNGGTLILAENVLQLASLRAAQRVTLLNTVPSAIKELLRLKAVPPSVRVINLAGEPLPLGIVQQLYQLPGIEKVYDLYGPSETTTYSTFTLRRPKGPCTIGQPLANTQIYLLDSQMQPVPAGVTGELFISGDGLARGYLNRPELTAEKFVPNLFSEKPGSRLYKTGDLARYFPDGNIDFLGRIDHQVKIRGFRIELGEIDALLRQHPFVRETIVIAREDQPGDKRLVAYVVLSDKSTTTNKLRNFLKEKLPEYMIPSVFVMMDSLPLTPNGKVDRKALPVPEAGRDSLEESFVSPRTPIEEMLAGIWCDVLGLKKISIHDNFFELGGHSLLATQVMSRLRKAFQVEIPLRSLFEMPTIAGLAGVIEEIHGTGEQQLEQITPVSREGDLALSFAQERLWFLDQLEPGSSKYNIPLAVRLSGHLHVAALEQSLSEILRRHEVLRTTFVTGSDQPVQVIAPPGAFTLSFIYLGALPEEQREARARELASEEASYPFDLATGPLLRATLLQLDPEKHVLLVTMHHIISDGWSMGIFYRELSVLYEVFSKGKSSPLPDLPIQYGDYAVWQRQWLQGKELEEQYAFWKEQLNDISTLELPTDHPRPSVQTFHGTTHTVEFPESLTEALWELSRKEGATLFMTLLAAFQSLLHRYTGQEDIVVGTPIANRNRSEIEGLIGFFVNTLVMRTNTSGDPVFRELLRGVRKTTLGAYAHQDLPFEKLVEELQPERDVSRNPLFQVIFALQNVPHSSLDLSGLTLSRMGIEGTRTRVDLEVHLWEESARLRGSFVYNTDLFDSDTIRRMAEHYQRILEGIVADPDQRLSELPLLTESEWYQMLVEWNDTTTEYPRDKCIHELFEEQAERTPEAIALVFEGQQLIYRKLNDKANQLAHYLRKQGVGPDVLVGICVERSLEMIIGILGILKAGGAYVPLDPSCPKERLAFMIEDTKASAILTQRHLLNVLPEHTANVICIDSDLKTITKESKDNSVSGAAAESLAYVIYTSGSTGRPKGVCVPHQAINRLVMNTNYIELKSSDRVAQASNFSFDAATFEIWGALLHGACLVGIRKEVALSPEDFAYQLRAQGISVLFLTTALFNQMARQMPTAFRSLRCLLFGGEKADTSCVRMVLEADPPRQLLHVYGPTESTTFTSWCAVKNVSADARTVPIGKPVANTTIYLLDRVLQPVPVGVPGELFIGADGLAQGYLNQTELTAGKFIPNPFSKEPGKRLYKTGDLARYLRDGNIEFLGRIDSQVKIRGFRIELGEIEATLGQHPDVMEAIVIVREHQSGDSSLVAYVVFKKNKSIARNELRQFLKEKLPDYTMPSAFVILDSLPMTPNGKIDRSALPIPDNYMSGAAKTFVAPRNTLEAQLAGIWEKILNIQPIGVTDNFFELGGHSLLAVRMASEIKKTMGKGLPVMVIFQFPTIEQLAGTIHEEHRSAPTSSLLSFHPGGSKTPLFWVYDTFLSRYAETNRPLYVLTHPSHNENLALYTTVEEIAIANLREMRSVQPEGPYFIGGYCFWGVVALEMAQQLVKQGEEVPLLCIVEPSTKCLPAPVTGIVTLPRHNSFKSRIFHHSRSLSLLRGKEKIIYLLQKLAYLFPMIKGQFDSKIIKKAKIALSRTYLFFGRPLPLSLRNFYLPNIHAREVLGRYISRFYPGRVLIFQADKGLRGGTQKDWNDLATGGVDIHEVPGAKHLNILQEPYVKIWTEQLSIALDKVDTTREAKKA